MSDVVRFPGVSRIDTPVESVMKVAADRGLSDVVVVGWDAEGEFYFASSYAAGPEVLWLLALAQKRLLEVEVE